ncbi:MAG TPA: M28 family peptidase [Chthoniobacteraceae bacterium]|nr:M28 family peptidase [Chthoniobacteraceae bacterium]
MNRRSLLPLTLSLLLALGLGACNRQPEATSPDGTPTAAAPGETDATARTTATPLPTPPPPEKIWEEFSGDKAFAHTEAQVALGPRPSGSQALEVTRALITAELERNGWEVERQAFRDDTPNGPVAFINLIARYGGSDKTQKWIICSHFDTKIFSTIKFVGASDGASSTGALMELSRVLALDPELAKQVELVFFDGEEAVVEFSPTDGTYGSRHYARELRNSGRSKQFKAGVLWDMIGDRDLTITLPPDSPKELSQGILAAADQLGLRKHFGFHRYPVWDDHVPLNQIKIPTIDLIDFDYPYWHTADDTLDKLSPESLRIVGAVTLRWLKTEVDPASAPVSPQSSPAETGADAAQK